MKLETAREERGNRVIVRVDERVFRVRVEIFYAQTGLSVTVAGSFTDPSRKNSDEIITSTANYTD